MKEKWNSEKYQIWMKRVRRLSDEQYRKFQGKLVTSKYEILGVRVPILKNLAKEVTMTDIDSFFKISKMDYYEEIMIRGFVIADILDEDLFWKCFYQFIPYIDNWAMCDAFCGALAIMKTKKEQHFPKIIELLDREEPFIIRVGLVIILNYYIEEKYLKEILRHIDKLQTDHYYVNMASAWVLSEMYTKYPKFTDKYFQITKVNDVTMNRAVQKIRESNRISQELKDHVKKYKRRVENGKKQKNSQNN